MQHDYNYQEIIEDLMRLLNTRNPLELRKHLLSTKVHISDKGVFISFYKTNKYQIGKFGTASRLIATPNSIPYLDLAETIIKITKKNLDKNKDKRRDYIENLCINELRDLLVHFLTLIN